MENYRQANSKTCNEIAYSTYIQTGKHTEKQIDRRPNKLTIRKTENRQIDIYTYMHSNTHSYRQIN